MIITVLPQKYTPGCGKGMSKVEKENLLWNLNTIIEWELSEFPKKEKEGGEVELRDFLGTPPELKPGDMFLFRGQVLAIDSKDTLVLFISETGIKALDRILEEYVYPETDLILRDHLIDEMEVSQVQVEEVEGKIGVEGERMRKISLDYGYYQVWKDKYVMGRYPDDFMLKVDILQSDKIFFPVTIYFGKWYVFYEEGLLDEDMTGELGLDVMSKLIQENDRVVVEKKEEEKK